MDLTKHTNPQATPQSQPIPGRPEMVQNLAGGYAWEADKWDRLRRFIVLGTEGGTYYATERDLTVANVESGLLCIKEDGQRVLDMLVALDYAAIKQDPKLFVLASACANGTDGVKARAFALVPSLVRTGTQLFKFVHYCQSFRGWGRGLRTAIGEWYNGKSPDALAYQLAKYQQRDGWSHGDVLRLAHPKPIDPEHDFLFGYALGKKKIEAVVDDSAAWAARLAAIEELKALDENAKLRAASLVITYGITRESVPTQLLNHAEVWESLLYSMPATAMVRNLATMTRTGVLALRSVGTDLVVSRLTNPDYVAKSKIHPFALFVAGMVYAEGRGMRGQHTWEPVGAIQKALEEAFRLSLSNVQPLGGPSIVAVDVSGSMNIGVHGLDIMCSQAAAALAYIHKVTDPECDVVVFDTQFDFPSVHAGMSLTEFIRVTSRWGGGTDLCQGIYAADSIVGRKMKAIVIYSDNESWYGKDHVSQAIAQYRRKHGTETRLAVCNMAANATSVKDPKDRLTMDFVGFDSTAPLAIKAFLEGS